MGYAPQTILQRPDHHPRLPPAKPSGRPRSVGAYTRAATPLWTGCLGCAERRLSPDLSSGRSGGTRSTTEFPTPRAETTARARTAIAPGIGQTPRISHAAFRYRVFAIALPCNCSIVRISIANRTAVVSIRRLQKFRQDRSIGLPSRRIFPYARGYILSSTGKWAAQSKWSST